MSADSFSFPDVTRLMTDGTEIDRALRRAVRAALRDHKRAGNPICEWRDGRVVWIAPEDIPDFPDEADEPPPVEPPVGS